MALATDKQTLIESVFLARLIESKLYGEPKDGLAFELADKAPDGLTSIGLTAAANAVIRKRNNGSFPALPACLAEIEQHCQPRDLSPSDYSLNGIHKDNYAEMAIAHGRKAGKLTVLERERDIEEWAAWRGYFASIGMNGSALMMVGAAKWTVPCRTPETFDASYRRPAALPDRKTERKAA